MTDVKRLLAEATPLPWGQSDDVVYEEGSALAVADCYMGKGDAALIVHAVNTLPDYEAAVDAATALILWIEAEGSRVSIDLNSDALVAARADLARLRGAW